MVDLKLSLELLKSSSLLRGSEYTVRVVQVDLPSVPKAIVALLSIPQPDGHADILQQLKLHCQENLASYLVPEFIFHSPLLSGQTEGEGSSSQADKLLYVMALLRLGKASAALGAFFLPSWLCGLFRS